MTKQRCPYCRTCLDTAGAKPVHCPSCGRYIEWLDRKTDFIVHGVDLWRLGHGQRVANTCFLLIAVLWSILRFGPQAIFWQSEVGEFLILVLIALHLALILGLNDLSAAFAANGSSSWILSALLALPGLNILALFILNWAARRAFGRIQMSWRLFGWSERQLAEAFDRTFCRRCGYDLTGNVSGRCPECGQEIGINDQAATDQITEGRNAGNEH